MNYYQCLTQFGKWCTKSFIDLTPDDLLDYSEWLDKQTYGPSTKKYSQGTKYVKQATVKTFLKNINPIASASITPKSESSRKLPEDLLTREEVEALIDNCTNSCDRALIATLYESGMRKGELFSIQLKSVNFDENGTVITIPLTRTTKTGARRIRVIYATEFLKKWVEDHPRRQDREHVLFCSHVAPHDRLTDAGLHN